MKKSAKSVASIAVIFSLFCFTQIFFCGCGYTKPEEKTLYLCVTADSRVESGKTTCGEVTAAVGYYLEKVLSGAESYYAASKRVRERMNAVSALAAAVVRKCGGGYGAEVTLEENSCGGELIIKLGAAQGRRESVEAYPRSHGGGVIYESLFADIVNRYL